MTVRFHCDNLTPRARTDAEVTVVHYSELKHGPAKDHDSTGLSVFDMQMFIFHFVVGSNQILPNLIHASRHQ